MNLNEILRAFDAPLNEEQAWALCHQCAKRFIHLESRGRSSKGFPVATGFVSIVISKKGEISIVGEELSKNRRDLVESFGRVLFEALEYGLNEEVERILSSDLERLIERMTLEDEGYEDSEEEHPSPCTWESVIKICEEHLDQPVKANEHYLAVCRALITEALDLKSFLEKVASTEESLKYFANINNNNDSLNGGNEAFPSLNFTEWAHIWIQVVSDLRFGVKLKKVEGYTRNVEYELTPYEILMEDIRQKNYRLKKVAVNGEVPERVKHDPHDIILDFIKSRPSLKPTKNRKLPPPPPRSKSLHELLLEQIQEPPSPLRHVQPPAESPLLKRINMEHGGKHKTITSSRSCDDILGAKTDRRTRLNAPPFAAELGVAVSTSSFITSDSDDEDTSSSSFAIDSITTDELTSTTINDESISPFRRHNANSNPCSLRSSGTSGVSSGGGDEPDPSILDRPGVFTRNTLTVRKKKVLPVDLLPSPVLSTLHDDSTDLVSPLNPGVSYKKYSSRTPVRRAHSMAIRPSSFANERQLTWRERRELAAQKSSAVGVVPRETEVTLPPPKYSSSPSAKRERKEYTYLQARTTGLQRTMSDKRTINPFRSQNLLNFGDYVKVTLKELIAIREKLVAPNLEQYQGLGEFYSNLIKGKVCFNCRVREFNIFWWAKTCEVCRQKICAKCMRKAEVPVYDCFHVHVSYLRPPQSPSTYSGRPNPFERICPSYTGSHDNPGLYVLRERNGDPQPGPQKKQTDIRGGKNRKMDVCEECKDLLASSVNATEMSLYHIGRPIFAADNLKRSVSSAGFGNSRRPPPMSRRPNFTQSKSVLGLRNAVE